ncbi:putative ATPase ECM3 NDAI_0B04090 [Naumovozyma dairenensis CBS 421]|uniref:Auxin efflux carrier component n=1 Tax=Naumovozyma dairenensis (strain ATCC 10597 / BCRC 20456 / CBS 421 / NBRC 0211 / NRRL Y-12639) TaxID=1071378 RepID=G0W6N2_NAUDC|nr:hypothetical protein NDAI_0B04090 [Naumovozyma dairenensis CBS 421]CCD23443.1 hypothetical protein NDAI_0B04090 [Naumovozyma dairenensis CBS 421]
MHITLGQAIWSSVKPIIKIYLIIGTGFLLSKMNILTSEATRTISDVVLTILLPCLSFNKIVANIEDNDIKQVGIICLTSVILFATGLGFAFLVRKFLPVPKQWYGGILAGGMFPNISDLPIAYIQTMDQGFIFTPTEGDKGVANVIIFLAMFLICVFNLGGFRLIENDFKYNDEENAIMESEEEENSNIDVGQEDADSHSSTLSKGSHAKTESSEDDDPTHLNEKKNHDENQEKNNGDSSTSSTTATHSQVGNSIAENNKSKDSIPKRIHSATIPEEQEEENEDVSSETSSVVTSIDSHINNSSILDNMNFTKSRRTASQPVAFTSRSSSVSGMGIHAYKTTSHQSIRSIDHRSLPAQDMNDLINEYSNVDQFGNKRSNTALSLDSNNVRNPYDSPVEQPIARTQTAQSRIEKIRSSNLTRILTSDATVSKKDIEESGSSLPKWLQKFPLTSLIVFFVKNCLRPCSMAVIIALIIAFIPWVKALFVTTATTPNIKQAPDEQPALSFIMDFTAYVGAASVPFGLILLGATLGKLKIGKLYPGFWKSAILLIFLRQCIMPIFGVLWCDRLVKAGWATWEKDKMLLFVIAITWNLPTMTTLIYFTASYTPVDCKEPIQMQCVAFFLMLQYPLMAVSMPFLVSYFLKVQMKL